MNQQDLDYEKHCKIPFGAFVQANQENTPTNTRSPRMIDCIYLRPQKNIQGGHEVMNVATGMVISRRNVIEVPTTDAIIKAVEAMAEEQGIKSLKLEGRTKIPLFPVDWVAGVDYDIDTINDIYEEDFDPNVDGDEDGSDDLNDETAYDRIEQSKIDDLLDDESESKYEDDANPTVTDDEEEDEPAQDQVQEEVTPERANSRPGRTRNVPERLTYNQTSTKTVKFDDEVLHQLELQHNLFMDVSPSPDVKSTTLRWLWSSPIPLLVKSMAGQLLMRKALLSSTSFRKV